MKTRFEQRASSLVIAAYSPSDFLAALAYSYDATYAIKKFPKAWGSNSKHCGTRALDAIKKRGNAQDLLWLYGLGKDTYHIVVTTSNHSVVAGAAYHSTQDQFLGKDGFELGGGEHLALLEVTSVADWFDEYFDYENDI